MPSPSHSSRILRYNLKKLDGEQWSGLAGYKWGKEEDFCENSKELFGLKKKNG